jgi:CheY-like chemotaxis protein/Tfp pilus assembly protein PilZ
MAERRLHLRRPFILRVDFGGRPPGGGTTENLSRAGLFIQTDWSFDIDESVWLSLSFPGLLDPIEIVGRVVWIRASRADERAGIGVRVSRAADQAKLEHLLNVEGAEGRTTEASGSPPEGYCVLIVEDNPHIIEMYSYVLKKLASGTLGGKVPLEVRFAPDGHSAFKQLMEARFNLVMTDLYMPVMDGFQLVEKIRQEEKLRSIPVIAISAGGKEAQQRALELGVDIYLRKPVRFVEVLETVKQLLHIK